MVPLPNLLTFALASVALIALPGPTVLFVIGRSLALGRIGGFLSVLGNALGMVPVIAAVALGLGAIVTQSVVVFTAIKFVGAAYIIYLGVHAIRHRRAVARDIGVSVARKSNWRLLAEGSVVGISNPKSMVFFVAVLPQFVDYRAGAVPLQLMTLGVLFVLLALLGDSVWALAAGSARDWFAKSPRRMENLSATGGVMMIGLGGVLAATGAQS
ncbi:threonine/homoserine/homoserine lactone efflux protein [Cryobacterium sp. MP_M5]|uniref:LysE family translocator n=1 Tax=unclassified Cryobacterium TaxID=2649013 RepID=UPI0018CA0772|nr:MULTISPECIES: LysE family translocator [unclassified Cryobacterium]MBG6059218.1 threonine/homoserine/homoserine lactone efflux protein [Cryobacterium sp. MP_M3]MEC5177512.1 threonine/homoserine/homoserine lactone efflux protein [Cryobacterium sp. MP_M5]